MEKSNSQVKITLIIVMITSFVPPFMGSAINLAIPSIGMEFGASQSMLNWVVSGYLISTAAFLLPFGRLADQLGRKRIFLSGMILLTVSSLACALSTSIAAMLCFRIIQGLAGSMIFSNSMALLTSVAPPAIRGRVLGFTVASTYIGLSAGPALGGFITSTLSWRGIFYFSAIIAVIIIIITAVKLKGEWMGQGAKIDGGGIILCVASQALLLFGLGSLAKGAAYQISFALGIALLVIFYLYEKKQANPLIPFGRLIKNKLFKYSNLAALINYSATSAMGFIISLYLQTVQGYSSASAGLILLAQPVVMAILSPLAGTLSDRVAPSILTSLGMGISGLGLFFFIFLGTQTSIVLIILNLAFIGLGFALFSSPNTNAVMGSVDKSLYGVGSSVLGNMRLLGQSASIAIVSLITSFLMSGFTLSSPNYAEKLMESIKISFIIFTVLCVFGVIASLTRGNAKNEG